MAVPVLAGDRAIGVVYATRNFTEHFIEEELNWLTAYAGTSYRIFYRDNRKSTHMGTIPAKRM